MGIKTEELPMSQKQSQRKKRECIHHRQEKYDDAIQKLIDGKSDPEYVRYRFSKLKRIT